jgi:hypothetical protein
LLWPILSYVPCRRQLIFFKICLCHFLAFRPMTILKSWQAWRITCRVDGPWESITYTKESHSFAHFYWQKSEKCMEWIIRVMDQDEQNIMLTWPNVMVWAHYTETGSQH